MYKHYLAVIIFNLVMLSPHAEVTLDGTLGKSGALTGPNYQIGADLGQQHGSNLFHSFGNFNLHSHESATFSGPNSVQNIISRVTGGNPSTIDGLIRSTIPNADLYFLNPYGILFGPNAKLDVQGGFHASTADYLHLEEGGRFGVLGQSQLTVAPPSAFGFLTDSPAAVDLQNTQLTVPTGQILSLTGGALSLNGAQLQALNGQITLNSLAHAGQIALAHPTLSVKGGIIALQNHTTVTTSGEGGGKVVIRGGQLVMDNSSIEAHTLGNQDGKGIDIVTDDAIIVKGDLFAINTPTFGVGKGGDISITTPRLEVTGSYIDTSSLGSGAGGDIQIQANQVTLQSGGSLASTAFVQGEGGSVHVNARDSLTMAGHRKGDFNVYDIHVLKDFNSQIMANSLSIGRTGSIKITTSHLMMVDGSTISVETGGLSDARSLTIVADSVALEQGSVISSDTFGTHAGGDIILQISGDLTLTGRRTGITVIPPPFNVVLENVQSGITSSTFAQGAAGRITISANRLLIQEGAIAAITIGPGSGKAGEVHLTVNELQLQQGGNISSSSGFLIGQHLMLGTGDGGDVKIEVSGNLQIQGVSSFGFPSGLFSNTLATGQGGNMKIRAQHLQLSHGGLIAANSLGTGHAGELTIQADTIEILDGGEMTTSAQYAAGGNIMLSLSNRLYLHRGCLTTSVLGGFGSGGNITIEQPQFVILNHSRIIAQADTGNGGNIHIVADQFIATPSSLISASSNQGISGHVVINSPDNNLSGNFLTLSKELKNIPTFSEFCESQTVEEQSHFKVIRHRHTDQEPEDWQASPQ